MRMSRPTAGRAHANKNTRTRKRETNKMKKATTTNAKARKVASSRKAVKPRKETDMVTVRVELPEDLYAKVQCFAEREGLSMDEAANVLFKRAVMMARKRAAEERKRGSAKK